MRSLSALLAMALGMAIWPLALGANVERTPSEYEVKAVFIYNLAKFVEWPPTNSGKVRLCLLGADPFGDALVPLDNRSVGDKRFISQRIGLKSDAELKGCDILFVARSEQERLNSLLQTVKGLPILTVGDTDGYARQGVMVNFYLDKDKVRFEINPRATQQAGLKLSAKLLRVGRLLGTSE